VSRVIGRTLYRGSTVLLRRLWGGLPTPIPGVGARLTVVPPAPMLARSYRRRRQSQPGSSWSRRKNAGPGKTVPWSLSLLGAMDALVRAPSLLLGSTTTGCRVPRRSVSRAMPPRPLPRTERSLACQRNSRRNACVLSDGSLLGCNRTQRAGGQLLVLRQANFSSSAEGVPESVVGVTAQRRPGSRSHHLQLGLGNSAAIAWHTSIDWRLADIRARYGSESLVGRFVDRAETQLRAATARVRERRRRAIQRST
jgi:hypothetical protein